MCGRGSARCAGTRLFVLAGSGLLLFALLPTTRFAGWIYSTCFSSRRSSHTTSVNRNELETISKMLFESAVLNALVWKCKSPLTRRASLRVCVDRSPTVVGARCGWLQDRIAQQKSQSRPFSPTVRGGRRRCAASRPGDRTKGSLATQRITHSDPSDQSRCRRHKAKQPKRVFGLHLYAGIAHKQWLTGGPMLVHNCKPPRTTASVSTAPRRWRCEGRFPCRVQGSRRICGPQLHSRCHSGCRPPPSGHPP